MSSTLGSLVTDTMILSVALFLAALFLAYANGANDNFKGVATLFGSRTADYKSALGWATLATFAGSICSIFVADALVQNFSGKGIVPDSLAGTSEFLLAVSLAAGLTVILATLTGFPVSTTHSMMGALVGVSLMAAGPILNMAFLGSYFLLPLLISPLMALLLASIAYSIFRALRTRLGVTEAQCLCIGETPTLASVPPGPSALAITATSVLEAAVDEEVNCKKRFTGMLFGINSQRALDYFHYGSASLVSFARGLNDTPKLVAILSVFAALDIRWGILAVALAMGAGALLHARKVAETLSHRITPLNRGQGFTANGVTATLVVLASFLGLPVSTTHVSAGSLFGIGLVRRELNGRMMAEILMAWLLTLPVAAIFGAAIYALLPK